MRYYLAVLFVVFAFGLPQMAVNQPQAILSVADKIISSIGTASDQFAAVLISHNPKSVATIQAKYFATTTPVVSKVNVLIVPGHEPDFGGTEFGKIKERDLNVMLADDLKGFLNSTGHYNITETRSYHSWGPEFSSYFKDSWKSIGEWEKASFKENAQLISIGAIKHTPSKVYHNKAPQNVATRLFGITKWANENDIDITIHIHFNDEAERSAGAAGTHSGFAIYVPAKQYSNSTTTKAVAESIFKQLSKYNPVSDLAGESSGIIDESSLIAIGKNNTANSASLLIEYGYIYEPQFNDPAVRDLAIKDLAYQTYLGLENFFGSKDKGFSFGYDTLMLPHDWKKTITKKKAPSDEVYALQTALLLEGFYPPTKKSLNDCPRSGAFGVCTKSALDSFQKKYEINNEKGIVGTSTLDVLNHLYSIDLI